MTSMLPPVSTGLRPIRRLRRTPVPPAAARDLLDAAVRTTAPLWPLEHFVAVNPFLGRAGQDFSDAAHALSAIGGVRMTLPRAQYRAALRDGRLRDEHLHRALDAARARTTRSAGPAEAARLPADPDALRAALLEGPGHDPAPRAPTVATALGEHLGRDWERFVTERFSAWAAAYFDAGQASWSSPWRDLNAYAAWRAETAHDRTPDAVGLRGLRSAVAELPADPLAAAAEALARLGIPASGRDVYLQRLAAGICGWLSYARYHSWQAELRESTDDTAIQLLAIRLAWDVALLDALAPRGARPVWADARRVLADPAALLDGGESLAVDLVVHEAYELAQQEDLLGRLDGPRATPAVGAARPAVQAVFCIDVRSEVFRRHLERAGTHVETLGFAGFFGFPIEYVPLGHEHGGAQCPALLTPAVVVPETLVGATPDEVEAAAARRTERRRASRAWKAFKTGAVSCFSFVGPVGLAYVGDLVSGAFGLARPVPHPADEGLDPADRGRRAPELTPRVRAGQRTGMTPVERLDAAEKVLRAMSLTRRFARVVLLAGHGSTTVNNAHGTGLDCGACGGHTGEANARVAAAVLNDPAVRAGLRERGIDLPADTVFVPALHDTTTDDVRILDRNRVPASHVQDVERVENALAQAARGARRERAPRLGVEPGAGVDAAVRQRAHDWSQVRPEWGLAGCGAFVVAPRERTRERDLGGRSFLHSYRWQDDPDLEILELIMTAPMVVATWISLQYFGSTVDNRAFGCGDKTLHNVVAGIGVLEGNGGDLRTGLPWQSVHDGARYVHEPVRLNVVIEAPIAAMTTILERHPDVRDLLDNRWLNLFAMDEDGAISHRYDRDLQWETVAN